MNKLFLAIIMIGFPIFVFSEEEAELLEFTRDSWNIAIESFSGSLSDNNEYLKSSIPDLIRRELLTSDMHVLSGNETSYYQSKVIEEKRIEFISNIASLYEERDNLLFSGDSADSLFSERMTLNEKIKSAEKKYQALGEVDSSRILTADLLKVSWIGSDDDSILNQEIYTPAVVASLYDLDFLISGVIKEIDEYFLLEVSGFSLEDTSSIQLYSKAGSADDMENMAIEAADEIRSIILGRPWSKLKVTTNQPDSLIYSNGILIGIGTAEVNTIEPGIVFLEAIGEDNSYWSEEVTLSALGETVIDGTLSASDTKFMTLSSEPAGADVYIGARWVGETPLNVPRYSDKDIWVSIKKEGYHNKSFVVSSESPEDLFYQLEVEEMSRMESFDLKKKDFYRSLGRFSLSLAAPVIMGGVYSNYAERYNGYATEYNSSSDLDDYDMAQEMKDYYYISYGVFWGTVGISSGLLVDVFVKLSRYIKAAEALAE
jgi:hypothetical protein